MSDLRSHALHNSADARGVASSGIQMKGKCEQHCTNPPLSHGGVILITSSTAGVERILPESPNGSQIAYFSVAATLAGYEGTALFDRHSA